MPISSLEEETSLFLNSYTKFRNNYASKHGTRDLAPYKHIDFPNSVPFPAAIFRDMAQEFLREVANELNRLDKYIGELAAWSEIYQDHDEEEQLALMMEFIEPLATIAVSLPATLRSRYIFSLSHTSHQANMNVLDGWGENNLPNDEKITFKSMRHCSSQWSAFEQFIAHFRKIDNEEWKDLTSGFRNKYHHRIPPRFELGHTQLITRELSKSGEATYSFGFCEPLSLNSLIDPLKQQHRLARDCFEAYSALLREQWKAIKETLDS